MSVFRVEKNKGYTVMSNHHLRNHTLSLKAKGLLSQMLSLPDDWDYTLQGLAQINKESIDAIREAVRELERAGYIKRSRERDERGCLRGTVYTIYEQPHAEPTPEEPAQALPALDNPILEKPMLDLPTLENPTQLNTKGIKYLNNKILKESSTKGIKESARAKKEPEQYFEDEELNRKFLEFLAMRKKIRKPVRTDRALKALLKKLHELSDGDLGTMKKIIDQSLDKEWLGFFELKTGNDSTKNINDRLYGDIQHWAAQKEQEGGGMYDDFGVF